MVHVGGCRPAHLDIDVMAVAFAVTGCPHGLGGQVNPPDEGYFCGLRRID
jgi:hypothetical protein